MASAALVIRISIAISTVYLSIYSFATASVDQSQLPAYKCNRDEILFQNENFQLSGMIIAYDEWVWQVVQFHYPDATTFLDIGANRGYTASTIFSLWSPGSEFNSPNLHTSYKGEIEKGLLKKGQITIFGGANDRLVTPLFCFGSHILAKVCSYRRSITVHSFDGQLLLYNDANHIIQTKYPHLASGFVNSTLDWSDGLTKATWAYHHAAMTNSIDFKVNPSAMGYFLNSGSENGKLMALGDNGSSKIPPDVLAVKLETVDLFCANNHIDIVDILKIDAEGSDSAVIHGANYTLKHRQVKMLTFECQRCIRDSMSTIVMLDEVFGFDCYSAGYVNVLIRLTQCVDQELAKIHEESWNSNVYCAPRGSTLHQSFENLSLYRYASGRRGDPKADALLNDEHARIVNGKVVGSKHRKETGHLRSTQLNRIKHKAQRHSHSNSQTHQGAQI